MPVIINRSGRDLKINEIQKIIPADGRQYVVDNFVFRKYRNYFEFVPVELQEIVEQQKNVIVHLKNKAIFSDIFSVCGLKPALKTLDVLFSFHFEKDIELAVERLRISIGSLINQSVRICVCNTSSKCIKNYLKDFNVEYLHIPHKFEIYCKSKTINLGVKEMVRSEYFFTSDIDLVYPATFVDYMSLFTLTKDTVRVIFSNYNLGKTEEIPQTFEKCKEIYKISKDELRAHKFYAPGNGLVHLPSFKKVKGYDERFIGHGSEDSEFNYRISKINKYFQVDLEEINTYHLWHEYSTIIQERINLNEQMWRYIIWNGETKKMPLIEAGEIKFPPDLLERDWSLEGRDFI